jgi:HprK-related kinase A
VTISQLSSAQLLERLSVPGLFLNTGPFVFQIQANIPTIAEGVGTLYRDFPIGSTAGFADFHVRLDETRQWRHAFRSYVSVEVDGDSPSSPLPLEQVYAVFEGCLNWCIYTHAYQYLIVHAAAIERDGRAVLMPAPPGSGKSTLCAALVNKGWRLLSDELALIDTDRCMVVPLARPISLKNESIAVIRNFAPQAVFGPTSPNTIKGTIAHMKPPRQSVERIKECCPVAWVVVPRYRSGAEISATEIRKGEGFMRVAESSVNYMVLGQLGFDLVSNMIDQIDCFRLEYGDLNEAVRWFDEMSVCDKIAVSPSAF